MHAKNMFHSINDSFVIFVCLSVIWHVCHCFVSQPERVIPDPDSKGFGVTSDVWSFGITMVILTAVFAQATYRIENYQMYEYSCEFVVQHPVLLMLHSILYFHLT